MTFDFSHLCDTTHVLDEGQDNAPRRVHLFARKEIEAIEAALKAQRPLLLRGEPGVGKSQLAEAFADKMGWRLFRRTLDANTDPDDLKWYEDSVDRLSKAQYAAVSDAFPDKDALEQALRRENFIRPGPLWEAFESTEASVVLIDEIDKADISVPNALLDALGSGRFKPPGDKAEVKAVRWPLVLLTTNEERPLPPAFLRRCFVLNMDPPEDVRTWLVERGRAVHGSADPKWLGKVADAVLEDRKKADELRLEPLPGLAEYLDLLRILIGDEAPDGNALKQKLETLRNFVLVKHRVR